MKKKIMALSVALASLLAVCVGAFWYLHPTHPKFNDRFVMGNTRQAIMERYGEPDAEREGMISYTVRENIPELIMSYDNSLFYEIYFENGIATRIHLQKGRRGG